MALPNEIIKIPQAVISDLETNNKKRKNDQTGTQATGSGLLDFTVLVIITRSLMWYLFGCYSIT